MTRMRILLVAVVLLFLITGIGYYTISELDRRQSQTDSYSFTPDYSATGEYSDYNEGVKLDGDTKYVLFFHSKTCVSCKELSEDLDNNLTEIPKNVTILEVDFDNDYETKNQYEIWLENSFVQIDQDSNVLHKWYGSTSLEDILVNIV